MKNSIVGVITVVIFGSMAYTISQGTAFQGGHAAKIIENVSQTQNTGTSKKYKPLLKRMIEISKPKRLKHSKIKQVMHLLLK